MAVRARGSLTVPPALATSSRTSSSTLVSHLLARRRVAVVCTPPSSPSKYTRVWPCLTQEAVRPHRMFAFQPLWYVSCQSGRGYTLIYHHTGDIQETRVFGTYLVHRCMEHTGFQLTGRRTLGCRRMGEDWCVSRLGVVRVALRAESVPCRSPLAIGYV